MGELDGVEGAVLGSRFADGVASRVELIFEGVDEQADGTYDPHVAVECDAVIGMLKGGRDSLERFSILAWALSS